MTHDELLAKIDYFVQIDKSLDGTMGIANWTKPAKALRAVVELHKPRKESISGDCNACLNFYDSAEWPCPTIEVIEKELS